jgi:hypothetical protein
MALCGFSCVWVYIFLGRLGFFFEEFLGIGIFGVGGEGVGVCLIGFVECGVVYRSNMKFINSQYGFANIEV